MSSSSVAPMQSALSFVSRLPSVLVAATLVLLLGGATAGAALTPSLIAHCVVDPVVKNNTDRDAGSLRDAIVTACAGSTITFAAPVGSPIVLLTGELSIQQSLTIQGPGASVLTISGNHTDRVFGIGRGTPDIAVTLSGLTIADGAQYGATPLGGGIYLGSGTSTIANCTLSGNSANGAVTGRGGAIYLDSGTLTIANSTLSGNSVSGTIASSGGGIYNAAGTLNVVNSWLHHNSASSSNTCSGCGSLGGAILNYPGATLNVTASTLSINFVTARAFTWGGAIYNEGTANVTNSTLSGNTAIGPIAWGGAIINLDNRLGTTTMMVTNSTLSGNTVDGGADGTNAFGGGIYSSGKAFLQNTIVAGNIVEGDPDALITRGPDLYNCCNSHIVSAGYNLIGDGTWNDFKDGLNHDRVGVDPMLDPNLRYNGGPTPTLALLAGSPARDQIPQVSAANDPATGDPITTDQRGVSRTTDVPNKFSDIGAFEFVSDSQPTTLIWIQPRASAGFGPPGSLIVAGSATGGPAGSGVQLWWQDVTARGSWNLVGYAPTPDSNGIWYNAIPSVDSSHHYAVYAVYAGAVSATCIYLGENAIHWCP